MLGWEGLMDVWKGDLHVHVIFTFVLTLQCMETILLHYCNCFVFVTAYVGRSLQTFEQTHYEYVKVRTSQNCIHYYYTDEFLINIWGKFSVQWSFHLEILNSCGQVVYLKITTPLSAMTSKCFLILNHILNIDSYHMGSTVKKLGNILIWHLGYNKLCLNIRKES